MKAQTVSVVWGMESREKSDRYIGGSIDRKRGDKHNSEAFDLGTWGNDGAITQKFQEKEQVERCWSNKETIN